MKWLAIWLSVIFLCAAEAAPAFAQSTTPTAETKTFDKRRLMVQPRNADGTITLPPFWSDPVLWLRDEQQNFYSAMSKSMRDMGEKGWAAALTLMLLSLGYGVFHAAGPGHGKAVVSGWLLATETQLRRGILVAFMSAMLQAVVAVALVSGVLLLVSGAGSVAKDVAGWLEVASFAMISGMGAYLLWGGFKAFPRKQPQALGHHFEITNPLISSHSHSHDSDHIHGPDCGHAHAPTANEVAGDWSWKRAAMLSLAVGLRPCSGAILVLLFAQSLGIYWAGVISTFVMGLGTFATVSVAATLAVYSKQMALRFAGQDARWVNWLNFALRVGGGFTILLFGVLLLIASWQGLGDSGF